jgi:hypothetical protein
MVKNLFGDISLDSTVKALKNIISRFTFDATGQLRTVTSGSVAISSGTVSVVTTSNSGFGDMGKISTAMLVSHQGFQSSIRRNFV